MRTDPAPKVRRLTVRAVRVPMREPHQTASGAVAESPLVLTDAVFDDGLVGHSVVFTYTPLALQPVAVVGGMSSVAGTLGTGVAWDEAAVTRYSV